MKMISQLSLLLLVGLCACNYSMSNPQPAAPTAETRPVQQSTPAPDLKDPTCCDPYTNDGVKKAWESFTKDGKYQLAQSLGNRPYAFTWGDLGYDYEINHHHLATIVEDTSQTTPARFGVVIFSAPTGEKGAYRPYWLRRDQEFSEASFSTASGYLELHSAKTDGSTEICDIRWKPQSKRYDCRKSLR